MASHPFADRWNHNAHYYPTIEALIPPAAGVVLDVGCGDGTLARYLTSPGRSVLGIDQDVSVLPVERDGIEFVAGTGEALPYAAASVDALTMVMVLHHMDPMRALAEVRRVVRPGGVVIVLGYAASGTSGDRWRSLADVAANQWYGLGKQRWEPRVVVAEPQLTWSQTRGLLERELPGGTYRRVPLWRYLYTWAAPG